MGQIITLTEDSDSVRRLCARDKRLCRVIHLVGSLTYEIPDNPYAYMVHEIIEQMITIKAGRVIFGRLTDLCDGKVTQEHICRLTDEELRGIGTSTSKVRSIRGLTDAVMNGVIDFKSFQEMPDEEVCRRLVSLHGIGIWTAKMVLIFVLDRQNILPYEDVAFLQSYEWMYKTSDRNPASVKKRCSKWSPYASIAARYLYEALDGGYTKQPFHLFKEMQSPE